MYCDTNTSFVTRAPNEMDNQKRHDDQKKKVFVQFDKSFVEHAAICDVMRVHDAHIQCPHLDENGKFFFRATPNELLNVRMFHLSGQEICCS